MPEKLVYILESNETLEGFRTEVAEMVFANQTPHSRLASQIKSLGHTYKVIGKKELEIVYKKTVFSDRCIYSDDLVKKLIEEDWVYDNQNPPAEATQVECTLNSSVCFDKKESFYYDLPFLSRKGTPKIPQVSLFQVPLNIPESIYPEKNYRVEIPNLFFQPIIHWPDVLKAQSLMAREDTIKSVKMFKPLLGEKVLRKVFNMPRIVRHFNKIGKNCRIHPTATLESCVIGDNVEIGAYSYLRGSRVGDGAIISEKSSIKLSTIGAGAYILPCDVFNCYIGKNALITTSIIFHCVIGDSTFIGGGVGFSDLNASRGNISTVVNNEIETSDQMFLGSAVAENCFIGAGLMFQSGRLIQADTSIINANMIHKKDFKQNKVYISDAGKVTQIPKQFLSF